MLQPVEPETLPPVANTRVPAEGDDVALVGFPFDDTNEVSCQELPDRDEPPVLIDPDETAIEATGVAGVVTIGAVDSVAAVEALDELAASELQAEARRAVTVIVTASIRYWRLCCNIPSAYVSITTNQWYGSTQRRD